MTTTTDSVTARQIRDLRDEAYAAGDSGQVDLCGLALGRWHAEEAADPAVVAALAECVRVIDDAEQDNEVTCADCGAPLGEPHSHGCPDCGCLRCRRDDMAWDAGYDEANERMASVAP